MARPVGLGAILQILGHSEEDMRSDILQQIRQCRPPVIGSIDISSESSMDPLTELRQHLLAVNMKAFDDQSWTMLEITACALVALLALQMAQSPDYVSFGSLAWSTIGMRQTVADAVFDQIELTYDMEEARRSLEDESEVAADEEADTDNPAVGSPLRVEDVLNESYRILNDEQDPDDD